MIGGKERIKRALVDHPPGVLQVESGADVIDEGEAIEGQRTCVGQPGAERPPEAEVETAPGMAQERVQGMPPVVARPVAQALRTIPDFYLGSLGCISRSGSSEPRVRQG